MHHWTDTKSIYGLGISLTEVTEELIERVQEFPNAVIHVIAGLVTIDQLKQLSNKGLKILVLGYKHFGRGINYGDHHNEGILYNINKLNEFLPVMIHDEWFDNISFDNLALKQIDVKHLLSDKEWGQFYMGDDGNYTFYIDLVENKFSKNSIAPKEARFDLLDNVDDMFRVIREKAG